MKNLYIRLIFWTIIVLLYLMQIAMVYQTRLLYRYEDVAINVIPVVWFNYREVFAVSTNIAWYAFLHIIYSIFGFSINTVQVLRVILELFTLISIAILLKRYLGYTKALIPLLTIGLSPTLTYFVTSSAPYGIELQIFPIILLVLDSINFEKKRQSILLEGVLWFLMMFGVLTYATFNLLLPVVGVLYILKLRTVLRQRSGIKIFSSHCLVSAVAFLAPLIAGLLYYKNPSNLFYNPYIPELGGLFRPSSAFVFDMRMFALSVTGTFNDLFNHGFSYYYQLRNGEFTHVFPVIPLLFVLGFSLYLIKRSNFGSPVSLKAVIITCWITIFANFLITNFSYDLAHLPGVRRFTPTLIASYVLFIIVFNQVISRFKKGVIRLSMIGLLLLLPIHHILVLPDNFAHLGDKSIFANDNRFELAPSPQQFLQSNLEVLTKEDLYLKCPEKVVEEGINIIDKCSYQNIFATLHASCVYNKLDCHQIYGFEPSVAKFLPITFDSYR